MAQSPSAKNNAHSSYKAVAPQMYATPTCMSTISKRNHIRLRCSLLFEPVKYMIFPLDLPSIQNHLQEHFEQHFSSSRKIEANTVHTMINHPWLIKPEIAAIDGRLLGWQTGAESNQQLGVPSQWWVSVFCKCYQNHIKCHEMSFRC